VKTFTKPLPGNSNVKGSGTGSPAGDMNKVSDALVEIRSSVPNSPSDVSAVTSAQLAELTNRVTSLVGRINALKAPVVSDAFTRTSLGSAYTLVSGTTPTFANNQIVHGNSSSFFVANQPTKTFQQFASVTVIATSTTVGHPQVILNYTDGSYYRGVYSISNLRWELYKMLGGTETLLDSFPAQRPSSAYTLKLSQYQNVITLSSNDAVKIAKTETSPLHGKQSGVFLAGLTDTSAPARTLDDFQYGDI
jgi:hypothetical protein